MRQVARNLADAETGLLRGSRLLLVDRDTKYCAEFRDLLKSTGTTTIRLPPQSPNLDAYAERFVGSIKAEWPESHHFLGEASLRRVVREYVARYHEERNYQGIANRPFAANDSNYSSSAPIARLERLGGVLSYYHRASA
jgi:putative transposase